ncbi:tyrosine--tRNA ligase [Haploplasma axanthum]|uniref:Tyrosine--tRNA ligase n=1 Tax=Haploplasma axanthum TaxID=29552 RepID=A0A449BFI0_HAPAX|nr:tyrosine--tRNA ligase [Haploplasma axanthum]VEU81196.1 tyrosyl tRNA synthetase [Haploplasma axanthum]
MSLYEELKWRDLIKDVSNEEQAKKLLDNEKVRFYCGFDPTGESLTVGHLVQVVRMKLLADHGHTPVVLIGGATGLIGDPRSTSERQLLTLEQSLKNAELIKKQISSFLDPKKTIYVNNNDWIKEIDMITFLRDYGKNFNLNYMLSKETVQSRLATGISYTEFSYMLIQAIDFLHLFEKENVKIQFGGSDQWGNITTGLELIRKTHGDTDAVGLSSPLLLKADGTKFGKSESGALWIDSELTTPYEIYQYFLNTSDDDISRYLRTLTLLSKEEILELERQAKEEPEKRVAQKRLAEEVVLFMHGKDALHESQLVTDSLFTGEFLKLPEHAFKTLEKTLDSSVIENEIDIVEALKKVGLASSNREVREFLSNGAVSVNGEKITDPEFKINKDNSLFNKYAILKRGKKKNGLIVIK